VPDAQREVLVLAYFGCFTQSEIATHLGVPLGTVKARAFQGLRRHTSLDQQGQPYELTRFVMRTDLTGLLYDVPVE
jgi:Sigma-70, region 4